MREKKNVVRTMSLPLAALSLASAVTAGGLTLQITEHYTSLKQNGQIQPTPLGKRLIGSYGNVWTAISAVSVAMSTMFLFMYAYKMGMAWSKSAMPEFNRTQKIIHALMLVALLTAITSAGLNLYLTDNYSSLGSALSETSSGTLRGSYGTAVFAMAIISVSFAGLCMGAHGWRMWESYRKQEAYDRFLYHDDWVVRD